MKTYTLIALILIWGLQGLSQNVSISNSPTGATWSIPTLSSNVTNAGKDYEHVETSGASHTLIKVSSLIYWSISIHQSVSSNWDPALKLYVRRTGDGTGLVTIANGTNYILLSSTPQPFFSGALGLGFGRDNIPIQYKIEGLSVMLPVKTYTTTIQYTVTGL